MAKPKGVLRLTPVVYKLSPRVTSNLLWVTNGTCETKVLCP